jgi:hypothetical protein
MLVDVCIPPGIAGGDELLFVVAETTHHCVVPEGLCEGEVFQVLVDAEACDATAPPSTLQTDNSIASGETTLFSTEAELHVEVPVGTVTGDSIEVQASGGRRFVVEVPDGLVAGMTMVVSLPPSASSVAPRASPKAARRRREPSADAGGEVERLYDSEVLRAPEPKEGHAFYAGQHIQMRRSSGRFSSGVVLDAHDAFETLYRCRIGDHTATLEKWCTESDLRAVEALPGFEYAVGAMVRVARACDGAVVLATVLEGLYVDDEPSYRLRLEPAPGESTVLVGACREGGVAHTSGGRARPTAAVETHAEDDVRIKTQSAPSCAFHVGQLVQVRSGADADGASLFNQLARVRDTEVRAGRLMYLCKHVPDGWGFPAPG